MSAGCSEITISDLAALSALCFVANLGPRVNGKRKIPIMVRNRHNFPLIIMMVALLDLLVTVSTVPDLVFTTVIVSHLIFLFELGDILNLSKSVVDPLSPPS
jgi:uncharacterized membrane protein